MVRVVPLKNEFIEIAKEEALRMKNWKKRTKYNKIEKARLVGSIGEQAVIQEWGVEKLKEGYKQGDFLIGGIRIELKSEDFKNHEYGHGYPTKIFDSDKTGAFFGEYKGPWYLILFCWVDITNISKGKVTVYFDKVADSRRIYALGNILCIERGRKGELVNLYESGVLMERNPDAYAWIKAKGLKAVDDTKMLSKSMWRVMNAKSDRFPLITSEEALSRSKESIQIPKICPNCGGPNIVKTGIYVQCQGGYGIERSCGYFWDPRETLQEDSEKSFLDYFTHSYRQ